MSDQRSECNGCHRLTPTIGGRCPECWYAKSPSMTRAPRRHRRFPVAEPLDLLDPFLWSWLPVPLGVVMVVVGLVLASPPLIGVGAVLCLLRIGGAFVPWDPWW